MSTDTYASVLRDARKASGLLQRELAEALGLHRAMQNDVELGKRRAYHVSRSWQIAEILGIDPVRLMALAAGERGIDPLVLEGCSLEALEVIVSLAMVLPDLSEAKLAALRNLIDGI